MEIELQQPRGLYLLLVVLTLGSLGFFGASVTPLTEAGQAGLLGWTDWKLLQAGREREAERQTLQNDAAALLDLLENNPEPVAAQMLLENIERHTRAGDPTLAAARQAVLQAAVSVRDWSVGLLEFDEALGGVRTALEHLQPNR